MDYYRWLRPILFLMNEERAHNLALWALRSGWVPRRDMVVDPALQVHLWGLMFNNPVGLAAGFDKNAEAIVPLLSQGFGFIEAGTVTPKPQSGNPTPRLFRVKEAEAVINRMGFNNHGMSEYIKNLKAWKTLKEAERVSGGIVGSNIGKNKDTEKAVEDYIYLLKNIYGLSDYITVNISSPNTAGLRDLQRGEHLSELLSAVMQEKKVLHKNIGIDVPILVKISPDVSPEEQEHIASVVLKEKLDGMIVSNTTTSREGIPHMRGEWEEGGLSGRPLFTRSTEIVRSMYRLTGGKVPIIGVGGISSGKDAYAKVRAGASLVQIYTAVIYQGMYVVRRINKGLARYLKRDGFKHISEAVGVDAK